MRRITLAIDLDYKLSAHVTIEDDGTTTRTSGNYWVTLDDFGLKTVTRVRITDWPRSERTGVDLIAEAFRQLGNVEREAVIP